MEDEQLQEALRILEREHEILCYHDHKRKDEEMWLSQVFKICIELIKEKRGTT